MGAEDFDQLVVDNLVTWRCNLRCRKCCVPKTGPEVTPAQFAELYKKLHEIGVRRIVLTGGDPLMRDDIADIARHAKETGFEVYLSTNGSLLKERWEKLSPYISWVSISLDTPTADLNERMTGPGGAHQFQKVLEFLQYYGNLPNKTAKVKLATVITKKNKDDLIPLGQLLFEDHPGYRPDIWRLYQFSNQFSDASDAGHDFVTENSVSGEEAERTMASIRERFPNITVSYRPAESRDESFIFISPDLTLTYPKGTQYITFGDTKSMSADEVKAALLSVRRIWGKIIQNREIYS